MNNNIDIYEVEALVTDFKTGERCGDDYIRGSFGRFDDVYIEQFDYEYYRVEIKDVDANGDLLYPHTEYFNSTEEVVEFFNLINL